MAQTKIVLDLISARLSGIEPQVITVRTLGDRLPPAKRGETDGKGAFTGDLEDLLAKGEIDLAVHSLKDLSVEMGKELKIGATPPRGDPRDALVSAKREKLSGLPKGATVGTSSIRRKVQLRRLRPDITVVDVRYVERPTGSRRSNDSVTSAHW